MRGVLGLACSLLMAAAQAEAGAKGTPERIDPDGLTIESIREALPDSPDIQAWIKQLRPVPAGEQEKDDKREEENGK